MAGKRKTYKPKKSERIKVDIEPTYPQDLKREAAYAQICAKGLEVKSYKVDPEELKAKYGKPKEPAKPQWPYTGHPQEDNEMAKWSKESVVEEVQALMNELGIECLPSSKAIEARNSSLKVMIQRFCGGMKGLADMLNVKTWQEYKLEEERAVKVSHEIEEKVHETEEKVQNHIETVSIPYIMPGAEPLKIPESVLKNCQPLPETPQPEPVPPHENMRYHYDRFTDRIRKLKQELEEAEHHLDGFVFAAEIMGVEL